MHLCIAIQLKKHPNNYRNISNLNDYQWTYEFTEEIDKIYRKKNIRNNDTKICKYKMLAR